jgi:hypothetical protein
LTTRTNTLNTDSNNSLRRNVSGLLILLMIVVTILNGFDLIGDGELPLWIAGIAAWLAALLLFSDTSRILKAQVSLILLAGIAMIFYAHGQQALFDPGSVISSNTGLLTMIAAVGFLRLVVIPDSLQEESLPTGRKAFLQTIIGLNISSSIINISAPIMIADRIHRKRPLQRFSAQTFTRIFCGVSSWSPFFGAMAVVLTYVNQASLGWIIVAGFPFMLVGAIGVYVEARLRYPQEVESFVGYPTHLAALKIPAILIVTVVAMSQLFSAIPILVVIAMSALLVTSSTLLVRNGLAAGLRRLRQHSTDGLPMMVNELCLFLAAGVLAAGISALIQHGVVENPFTQFDAITAAEVLGIMLFCAFCGIHPIIMISSFAPMIMTLDPDPNLLAATFLFAWHIGTCSNPLSGTNLVFQGRYSIPGWKLAFWNWPYALIMLLVGALWLQAVAHIFP